MNKKYRAYDEKDYNKASMLLHIIDVTKGWPKLDLLYKSAMEDLEAMCAQPAEPVIRVVPVEDTASRVEDEAARVVVKVDPIEEERRV